MTTIQRFFDGDDYLPLRRESYNFVAGFVNSCVSGTNLLEIGPSGILIETLRIQNGIHRRISKINVNKRTLFTRHAISCQVAIISATLKTYLQ